MASKVTLINLAKVDSTITNDLNTNFTRLADAIDDALDRTGASPNQLEDDIDANDFQIKNLGKPSLDNHALRLADITDDSKTAKASAVTIDDTGGHYPGDNVESALEDLIDTGLTITADHTFSGDPTFSGDAAFTGSPVFNNLVVDPEHATDSGTDAFVSATNTSAPSNGVRVIRDFQSASTTTTPTLDGTTITTKDGSALWAGALSGVHELQYDSSGPAWRVVDPVGRADITATAPALVFATAGTANNDGAVGDGSTDDTEALQALIDEISTASGGTLDLEGQTYRVDSTLIVKPYVRTRNGTLDFSSAASGDTLFETENPSLVDLTESQETLTSSASRGDTSLSVGDSSAFSPDDYIWIESTESWGSDSTKGEFAKVLSVPDGTTINLREPLTMGYTTGGSATVEKIKFTEGFGFEHVTFQSDGTSDQKGCRFNGAKSAYFADCVWHDFDERTCRIDRSIHVDWTRCKLSKSRKDGLAYGISIANGCHWITVSQCHFEDQRHGVTVGGSNGVNRYVIVSDSTFYGQFDSGVNCHEAAQFIHFIDNTITCTSGSTGSGDGIVAQGADVVIKGNTVRVPQRHGILCQPDTVVSDGRMVVEGNTLHGDGVNSDTAILVQNNNARIQVSVCGNTVGPVDGFNEGISVEATSGNIDYVNVNNNQCAVIRSAQGIKLSSTAGNTIRFGAITGNVVRCSSTSASCIFMDAADASGIANIAITGNTTFGGDHGVEGVNTDGIAVVGNVLQAYNDTAVDVDGSTTVANNRG